MDPLDIDSLLNELGVTPDEPKDDASTEDSADVQREDVTDDAKDAAPSEDSAADQSDAMVSDAPEVSEEVRAELDEESTIAAEPEDDLLTQASPEAMAAPRTTPEVADLPDELPGLTPIYQPSARVTVDEQVGALLLEREHAEARQIAAARTVAEKSPGERFLELLEQQGVHAADVLSAYAEAVGTEFRRVAAEGEDDSAWDGVLLQRLGVEFCKDRAVLPLAGPEGCVHLGAAHPDDILAVDEIRLLLKADRVHVVAVPLEDIQAVLETFGGEDGADDLDVEDILGDIEEDDVQVQDSDQEEVDLEREAGESPVIRYVNYIIHTAVKEGASDIHIEPGEKQVKVRFRIDGVLFEMMHPPAKMASALTSRLKIMANLDIAERRVPQDGRIRCQVKGRKLDLRVSTIPTACGEKTVMRILDTKSINVSLDDLGFDEDKLQMWKTQVSQPHGIVLVTGPTGSGKTTTLYASLRQLDKTSTNISTVEDPIEYHLDGITQTQTHERIGMTFAKALKALLRQDPDIIMIGEIRDEETAHTAIQAALTGHLVLSTLHTNDAPSAITRLVNIGLEPFLIGAAVNAVLAQRLARKICSNCVVPAAYNDELMEFIELQGLDATKLMQGEGCDKCRNTGHQGRVGLYELLVIDDMLRDVIARNPNVTEFRRTCIENGMVTLRQDGFTKVQQGRTTINEILRVTEATM